MKKLLCLSVIIAVCSPYTIAAMKNNNKDFKTILYIKNKQLLINSTQLKLTTLKGTIDILFIKQQLIAMKKINDQPLEKIKKEKEDKIAEYKKLQESYAKELYSLTNMMLKQKLNANLIKDQLPYVLKVYGLTKDLAFKNNLFTIIENKIISPIVQKTYEGDLTLTLEFAATYNVASVIETIKSTTFLIYQCEYKPICYEHYCRGPRALEIGLTKTLPSSYVNLHKMLEIFITISGKGYINSIKPFYQIMSQLINRAVKCIPFWMNGGMQRYRESLVKAVIAAQTNRHKEVEQYILYVK